MCRARLRARAAPERGQGEREVGPEWPVSTANKNGNGTALVPQARTYPRSLFAGEGGDR